MSNSGRYTGFLKAPTATFLLSFVLGTYVVCQSAAKANAAHPGSAKSDSAKPDANTDFSKEGVVIEKLSIKAAFQNDGTYTYDQHARVRVQSDAGVRAYGVLRFAYQSSGGGVEVQDVHVLKPNGSVVATPLDSVQDMTSEISRDAPVYSDLHEKHVAVRGLEPGNVLEYSVEWKIDKPFAPGQFWSSWQFTRNAIVLDEQLEISVPREREVKLKSQTIQPTMREEGGRRIYLWKSANLESESGQKQIDQQTYEAMRGLLPTSDVQISSFRSWEEVGRWYESLQREKVQPSPEVKAKAEELTKGLTDDAKISAIYNYVSLRYRYVAISFGVGRYQPHSAADILGNQYGDCKDKHTLLAALLSAVGIQAYPALINTRSVIEPDVPSPGQFDHVISVVANGKTLSWMDTTPEVAPKGFLVSPLRGKPALVIAPDKVEFQTTPADPLVANSDKNVVTSKLDADGELHAHSESTYRGDNELYFRSFFRRVPESHWKDYAQHEFYGARRGGTVSDVQVSPAEQTEAPFTITYDYTLKDFWEGDKHRFIAPIPPLGLPEVKDEDLKRNTPLWIGYEGQSEFESRLELPKGWSATPSAAVDLKESFAEFQESSEVKEDTLITKRRLVIKASGVTADQLERYRAFEKTFSNVYRSYTLLRASANVATGSGDASQQRVKAMEHVRDSVLQLPSSSNAEAVQAEQDGRGSITAKDYASAIVALKRAVSLDPSFCRAWVVLAATYSMSKDTNSAIDAGRKAIEADPKQVIPYKLLAFMYMGLGRWDDAISTWQTLQGVAPDDTDLAANLGKLYFRQKRYAEAAALYEAEVKKKPSDANAQMQLAIARMHSHSTDLGLEALHKALELDSSPEMLNTAAYEMAETDTMLPDALAYSLRSVKEVEQESQKIDLANLQKADLQLAPKISAYWDTLGWIYFKLGELSLAESYLKAAWELSQTGVIGDHLGQLYERKNKLPQALHTYTLAFQADPRLPNTLERIRKLAHGSAPAQKMNPGEELSRMRTVKLPDIVKEQASADFNVLLAPSGKIEMVTFLNGSELLRKGVASLGNAPWMETFPKNSTAHVLRRGILSCSSYTGCSFVFYPISVAATQN